MTIPQFLHRLARQLIELLIDIILKLFSLLANLRKLALEILLKFSLAVAQFLEGLLHALKLRCLSGHFFGEPRARFVYQSFDWIGSRLRQVCTPLFGFE